DAAASDAPVTAPDARQADAPPPDAPSPDAAPPDAAPPDAAPPDVGIPPACGDLRLWYRFEETSGSGVDWGGCGNDGAASAVTRGEPGHVGSAYRFNSATTTNANVLVTDSPSLSDLGMLTLEAWVRHTGGILEAILDDGDGMGGDPFIFHTG